MPTLEQLRAKNAWECALQASHTPGIDFGKYANAAKALPALIMNSGLMQVLAFCHNKKDDATQLVAKQLRVWLCERMGKECDPGFEAFMQQLMDADPADYRAINAEAFAWLRWLRQMASALQQGD